MTQTDKGILPIIARYQKPAIRLAQLQLKHSKALATQLVTIVLEEIYEEQLFFEGPHLRSLIIKKINSACNLLNRLAKLHPLSTGTPLYHYPMRNQ
ncbi:MAG: hypothetical protein QM687_04125 [Ferruginibacter sp.]